MMMQGLHFMGDVPFKTVHIHGLVRDEKGQKMSKTKGNVVDPLALIDKYGADALRFTLLASTAHGRDIKFGESRVEGYRNFATKLWNAARFAELNGMPCSTRRSSPSRGDAHLNRWIIGETAKAAAATTAALEAYRFNDAALGLYHFVWNDVCDWYIELAKPVLLGDDPGRQGRDPGDLGLGPGAEPASLHPMAPFVSEALWRDLFGAPGGMLIAAEWPSSTRPRSSMRSRCRDRLADPPRLRHSRGAQRGQRAGWPPSCGSRCRGPARPPWRRLGPTTRPSAGSPGSRRSPGRRLPAKSLQLVEGEASYALPVGDVVDLEVERKRLGREIEKLTGEAGKLKAKLGNADFLSSHPRPWSRSSASGWPKPRPPRPG
jgi:valyl-tRNA synthetase